MKWCEHCRDHFEADHYDTESGVHGVGPEYGPYGELLAAEARVPELEAALRYIAGYDVAGYEPHLRPEDVAKQILGKGNDADV